MSKVVPCPICNHIEAELLSKVPNQDAFRYSCPRCGAFDIDHLAIPYAKSKNELDRSRLTIATRAASDSGRPPFLRTDSVDHLIEAAPSNRSLFDGVDRTLLLLARRADRFRSPVKINSEVDYPLVYAHNEQEMNDYLTSAAELGFFDAHKSTIALDGWRRIEEIKATVPRSQQAFVAMWFDPQMDDAWLHGFKKGIEETDYYHAVRIDTVQHNEKIDDRIVAEIRRSGLLIADFTGDRGGVYFEAGYAAGLGIPVIWTCRSNWVGKLHFDTRQYNHIVWDSASDLSARLRDRIAATVVPRAGAA